MIGSLGNMEVVAGLLPVCQKMGGISLAFCCAIARVRVKRCSLVSYVSMGNMLPESCRLGRPALEQ
jgi:hypothetical protein